MATPRPHRVERRVHAVEREGIAENSREVEAVPMPFQERERPVIVGDVGGDRPDDRDLPEVERGRRDEARPRIGGADDDDPATASDQVDGLGEGVGHAGALDDDVGAAPVGVRADRLEPLLGAGGAQVDHPGGTPSGRDVQPAGGRAEREDLPSTGRDRARLRIEPDRPHPLDHDGVRRVQRPERLEGMDRGAQGAGRRRRERCGERLGDEHGPAARPHVAVPGEPAGQVRRGVRGPPAVHHPVRAQRRLLGDRAPVAPVAPGVGPGDPVALPQRTAERVGPPVPSGATTRPTISCPGTRGTWAKPGPARSPSAMCTSVPHSVAASTSTSSASSSSGGTGSSRISVGPPNAGSTAAVTSWDRS